MYRYSIEIGDRNSCVNSIIYDNPKTAGAACVNNAVELHKMGFEIRDARVKELSEGIIVSNLTSAIECLVKKGGKK